MFPADFRKFESVFEKSPDEKIIDYTLAVLTPRKIDNGNAIKFKNKYYQPYLNNELKCFKPKTECLVIKSFKNNLLVTIDDKVYELRELNKNALMSDQFDDIKKEQPIKPKYIPPMTHPWRLNYFLKEQKRTHNKFKIK
ncbi:MAG: hypothetical protein ACTTJP_03410 [Candidatus Onthovivens sp.]